MILNNKGLTLLEVLLSVVILSIVLTSFLSLFPTAASFNNKTNETLSGINLGKQKIGILENIIREDYHSPLANRIFCIKNDELSTDIDDSILPIFETTNYNSLFLLLNIDKIQTLDKQIILHATDWEFETKITINREPAISGGDTLFKVSSEVQDSNGAVITNAYGYLSIKKKEGKCN